MSKIVVVGANHAGTACINTMLDNFGHENEIVVFDQNSNISFLGCGMALWIGEQIDGPEGLFYSDKEKLEAKGAKVYMNSPVLSIDYDNKVVTAEVDGKEHRQKCRDKDITLLASNVTFMLAEKTVFGKEKPITWYFYDNFGLELNLEKSLTYFINS